MAIYSHLIADNGGIDPQGSNPPKHLASIENTASHLVRVRQMTDWSNKEFVVAPTECKFTAACSWGQETYQDKQSGALVGPDTDWLWQQVRDMLSAATWNSGNKALFTYFSRANDISYCVNNMSASSASQILMSGHGRSCVAYKFNLRHLHFSKLTSFEAYVRLWQPSFLARDVISTGAAWAYDAIIISGTDATMYNDAAKLRVKFARELPENSTGIDADGSENFTFTTSNCNNKTSYSSDHDLDDCCIEYSPWGWGATNLRYGLIGHACNSVYMADRSASARSNQKFYTDFKIEQTQQLNILKTNPGTLWVLATFHAGNGIAGQDASLAYKCLAPNLCIGAYAQRLELVLKCTGSQFNRNEN